MENSKTETRKISNIQSSQVKYCILEVLPFLLSQNKI